MNPSPIRLIALDLDGTTLNDAKELTPRTAKALSDAGLRGIEIVPATGRTASGVPDALRSLPGVRYAITANGARSVSLSNGQSIGCDLYIPHDAAVRIYDILSQYDCLIDIFQDGQGYTTAHNVALVKDYVPKNLWAYVIGTRKQLPDMRAFIDAQTQGLEKYTMFFRHEEERQAAWEEVSSLGMEVVSSLPLNMEINGAGVNKGQGLLALAQKLGLSSEQLMAFGDGGNDVKMIAAAGLGVAMSNAVPEAKAVAKYITLSNNEEGVADAIEKLVLAR